MHYSIPNSEKIKMVKVPNKLKEISIIDQIEAKQKEFDRRLKILEVGIEEFRANLKHSGGRL